MARKHERFAWGGYKYAPETVEFSFNGKRLNLPDEVKSSLAYLAVCGRDKEVIDGLKRILRKEEKQPRIIGKCICFFREGSNEYYYTQQLRYKPDNIQDALWCYKEWKRYIESKNCMLEVGYTVTEGEFNPFGENKAERREVIRKVDLSRCRTINVARQSIFA